MIALEDERGIFFQSEYQIASLTPDFAQRWRAVLPDGSVAHRPGPLPPGPWRKLGDSWVNPAFLERTETGWRDPAGFLLPAGELAPLDPPPVALPIEGLPCSLDQVLSLEADRDDCIWHTDCGDFRWPQSVTTVAQRFPELVLVVRGLYVNRNRLARVIPDAGSVSFSLFSDSGALLTQIQRRTHQAVAERFGLAHFEFLEPRVEALSRWLLRDWPLELARAKAPFLRANFFQARTLIMNVVWQAVRYRQMGIFPDYGDDYRGFFYDTLYSTLYRAGFMSRAKTRKALLRSGRASEDALWGLFQDLVAQAVGGDRLFDFHQLGFADPAPQLRFLGTTRPELVVVAEKTSLHENLQALRQQFGVTTVITGGQPKLLAVEYFVSELRTLVAGPVRVIAYVDYDPAGWVIARAFVQMLERYGISLQRDLQYLVRAELFTAEEVELFALACPAGTPTINEKWLAESGGFGGQALGMHCNHLRPFERVLSAFEALL